MHHKLSRLLAAGFILFAIQLPAKPASAHGTNGLSPSSELTTILGVTPPTNDFSVRVIGHGDKIEVRRNGNHVVEIPGYQNEPYLRIDAQGVWRNNNSPSRWSNEDREGLTPLPPEARVDAQPDWQLINNAQWVQWHDHRAHTMVQLEIVPTTADDSSTSSEIVQRFSIDVIVDGQQHVVTGQIERLQRPHLAKNLLILGCVLVGCTTVLLLAARRPFLLSITGGLLGLFVLGVSLVHAIGAAQFAGDQLNQSTQNSLWLSSYFAIPGWLALAVSSATAFTRQRAPRGLLFAFGMLSTVTYGGLLDWSTITNTLPINALEPETVRLLVLTTIGVGLPVTIQALHVQWRSSRAALATVNQDESSPQATNETAT